MAVNELAVEYKPKMSEKYLVLRCNPNGTVKAFVKNEDVIKKGVELKVRLVGDGWVKNPQLIVKNYAHELSICQALENKNRLAGTILFNKNVGRIIVDTNSFEENNSNRYAILINTTEKPPVTENPVDGFTLKDNVDKKTIVVFKNAAGDVSFLLNTNEIVRKYDVFEIVKNGKGWKGNESVYLTNFTEIDPSVDNNRTGNERYYLDKDQGQIIVEDGLGNTSSIVIKPEEPLKVDKNVPRVIYEEFTLYTFYNWIANDAKYNVRGDKPFPNFWNFLDDCREADIRGFRFIPLAAFWGSYHANRKGSFLLKPVKDASKEFGYRYHWGVKDNTPIFDELFIERFRLVADWLHNHGMELHLDIGDHVQFNRGDGVWMHNACSKFSSDLGWCVAPEECRHEWTDAQGQQQSATRRDPKHQWFNAFKGGEQFEPHKSDAEVFKQKFYSVFVDKMVEILRPYRESVYLRDGNEVESSSYSAQMCEKLANKYPHFVGIGSNNEWLYSHFDEGDQIDPNHRNFSMIFNHSDYLEVHHAWPDNIDDFMHFLKPAWDRHQCSLMLSTDGSGLGGHLRQWRSDEKPGGSRPSFQDHVNILEEGLKYGKRFFGLSVKTLAVKDMYRFNSEFKEYFKKYKK